MTTSALWTRHRPIAYKAASEYRIPGMEPEDVRQEALLALWEAARSYDPARGSFPAWARLRVTSHLVNLLRAATADKRTATTVPLTEHEAPQPAGQLELAAVVDALPTLTQGERGALAHVLSGTYDSRDRTVENQLCTARRKLRKAAA